MDPQRLAELEATRQALNNGATAYEAIVNNISSGVDAQQTLGFIGDVGKKAEEYQLAKAFYNGSIADAGRGLAGTGKMLNELYAERVYGKERKDDLMLGWNNVINSSMLKPYEVENTFANNLASGAGQLATQAAVSIATRGAGSMAFMGAQITGNQYLELREAGVDTQRAAIASIVNAGIQAPLEQIGFEKIIKANPAAKGIYKKAAGMAEAAISEAVTEGVETFPEQLTNIWAKNKGIDLLGVGRKWDENAGENLKEAGYSAAVAFVLGGSAKGVRYAQMYATDKYLEKVHEEKVNITKQHIEEVKNSKINPDYAVAIIDNNLRGTESVTIEAQALHQYMQTANAQSVADSLGVTVDEVQKAAEDGLDVTVSYGDYVGTSAKLGDSFTNSVEEHISFQDSDGISFSSKKLQKALDTNYKVIDKAKVELDAEIDKIIDSATKAGVTDAQNSGLRELLISRALVYNPDNPAQFFKDHPLEFQNAGKVDGAKGLYYQGEIQTNSEAFKQWFGNSKAVDENGKPKVFYRGTQEKYDVNKQGKVTWITESKEQADSYAGDGKDSNTLDVYAKIENPFNVGDSWTPTTLSGFIENKLISAVDKAYGKISKEKANEIFDRLDALKSKDDGQGLYVFEIYNDFDEVSKILEELGYDAIATTENGNITYGVIGQNNVKSATENNGSFDANDPNIYHQQQQMKDKGAISWDAEGKAIINLFKGADASTVIHETGHYFVEAFMQDSGLDTANEQMKKDRKALLEFVGMTEEQWANADFEGKREAHEKLAEGFESYIIEGKPPVKALRGVFKRFSTWLRGVYSTLVNNEKVYDPTKRNEIAQKNPINDDVRQVFDHWLATQEEIEATERIEKYFASLPKIMTDNLNEKYANKMKDYIEAAHDKAVEILLKQSMANFTTERKKRIQAFKESIRADVEKAVAERQIYRTIAALKNLQNEGEFDGAKLSAKNIARRYLNKQGKDYDTWQDALNATQAEIDDLEGLKKNDPETFKELKYKEEYKRLLERRKQLNAFGQGMRADYQGDISAAYRDALMLKRSGIPVNKIKSLTGWEFKDNQWKYAVDREMSIKVEGVGELGKKVRLDHILDAKALYQKLPFLKNVKVVAVETGSLGDKKFEFDKTGKVIKVDIGVKSLDPKKNVKDINALADKIIPAVTSAIQDSGVNVNTRNPMMSIGGVGIANINVNAESWRNKLSANDRVKFEILAELNGYTSGDHLAYEIINNPTLEQAVERQLKVRADQEFPSLLDDRKKAEEAAREALYNDESGKVVALEQQLIYDQLIKNENRSLSEDARIALEKQLKAIAEKSAKIELGRMTTKEAMNTKRFIRAERRAAANVQKALEDGDWALAQEFKRQQALCHAMVRESLKIKQYVKQSIRFLSRQRKMKKETWGTENHFNQVAFLLSRMGIARKDYDPNARQESLAQYIQQQQQENSNYIDIADWLTNETIDISSPDKLTLSQYEDIIDALKNIRAVANAQNESSKLAKDRAWTEFKNEIHNHLAEMQERYRVKPGEKPKAKFFRELLVTSLRSTDNLLEFMDNWHYGWFSKTFGEPLKMCADMQSKMEMEFKDFAAKSFLKWCPDVASKKAIEENVYYDELGISCSKRWLIQMVANLGNDGNARMLCSTMPTEIQDAIAKDGKTCDIWVHPSESISAEDAWHQTRDNLVAFLSKNLTAADIEYAQSLIDNAGRHWNERADLDRRTKGFAPAKVEATPVIFQLADGSIEVLKGGYFPLIRDSRVSHPKGLNSVSDTDPNEGRNINPMHTNTGSSKNRTMATYPVSLIPGCEFRSVMDGIHDICYREVIADFRTIFNDEEIAKSMREKLGVAEYEHLRETIESTANPYGNAHLVQAERWQADCISWLRRKTVNAAIMLNLKTALQNLSNVTLFGNAVEGFTQADAWRAVFNYGFAAANMKNRELHDFVMEKSVFMKERVTEPDISLKEIINEGELNAIEKATTEWGAKMLAYTDNLTAIPCWVAAYNKKLEAGASEQDAINFADTVVRRTLGSSRIQDVSSLQRGGPIFKMLTTFQGFWNTQFNQWDREYHILRRDLSEGKRKEAIMRFSAFLASKWIATCIISCAMGLENPFEEDKKGNLKMWDEIRQYPLSMMGPLGQAGNFLINSALGTSSYSYRMAAIQSTIDKGIKLARTGNRFVNKKAGAQELIESATSLAGPILGVPDELNKLFWNNYDYLFNGMTPELHDLVARRPKSERK